MSFPFGLMPHREVLVVTKPFVPARSDEHELSELCHALSQPLTALRCALDLALRDGAEREIYVAGALSQCERATRILAVAQSLAAAASPPTAGEDLDLAWTLRKILEELRPIAEAQGCHLDLNCLGEMRVCMEPARLRSILYGVIYAALRHGHHFDVRLCLTRDNGYVLTLETRPFQPLSKLTANLGVLSQDRHLLGLAIAERALTAAGGMLLFEAESGAMVVRFPSAK